MASLEAMLQFRPKKLYPGHGPHIQDAVGLLSRYVAHLEKGGFPLRP